MLQWLVCKRAKLKPGINAHRDLVTGRQWTLQLLPHKQADVQNGTKNVVHRIVITLCFCREMLIVLVRCLAVTSLLEGRMQQTVVMLPIRLLRELLAH